MDTPRRDRRHVLRAHSLVRLAQAVQVLQEDEDPHVCHQAAARLAYHLSLIGVDWPPGEINRIVYELRQG
jgi:hypothetical protein